MMLHADILADEFDTILGLRTSHTGIVQAAAASEQFARLVTADGDYLSNGATGALANASGFTLLVRESMVQDTLASYLLRFVDSVSGSNAFVLGRLDSASGNVWRMVLRNASDAAVAALLFSGHTFQAANGVRTYLFAGDRTANVLYAYWGDQQVYAGAWPLADDIDFSGSISGLPIDTVQVGKENNVNPARSDFNLNRLVFWPAYIGDVTQASVRRTLYSAAGIPEDTMPGSPWIDIGAPAALIRFNNASASIGDFTVNGYPVPVPYSHHLVRLDGSSYLSKAAAVLPNFQYATLCFKARWDCLNRTFMGGWEATNTQYVTRVSSATTDTNLDVTAALSSDPINFSSVAEAGVNHDYIDELITWHIAMDLASDRFRAWRNGVLFADVPWTTAAFTADASAIDTFALFTLANSPGTGNFVGLCGVVWMVAGATSASLITDPALFYNGGDVDFGPDGTSYGALPAPQLYMGGVKAGADWHTNRGTGGDFTVTGTIAEVSAIADDTTPAAFSFTDQTDVALSTTITSASITPSGFNRAVPISVTGGEYQLNNSGSYPFTSAPGVFAVGETVKVRHTSAATNGTATNTVLTIGGVSDTFTSTTVALGYDTTLSDTDDDGHQFSGGTYISNVSNHAVTDNGGAGLETFGAACFPSVGIANSATIASATLYIYVQTENIAGLWNVHGQNPTAAGARIDNTAGNQPDDYIATAIAGPTGITSAVGLKTINVTSLVQAMVNDADWASGDYMNFIFAPQYDFVDIRFTSAIGASNRPRLVITL